MKHSVCLLSVVSCLIALSCTTDSYEKGTGKYSLMLTGMADVTIGSDKRATSFITDDGDSCTLSPTVAANWIEVADTAYRAIVYYNKNDDGTAQALSMGRVPTLQPREHWRFKRLPQDPVGVESAWASPSGKYINLGLLIRSGATADSTARHSIALSQDTIRTHASGRRTAELTLLHDQGGVPEYYTDRHYVSILLPADCPDTVVLNVQTYSGLLTRRFAVR